MPSSDSTLPPLSHHTSTKKKHRTLSVGSTWQRFKSLTHQPSKSIPTTSSSSSTLLLPHPSLPSQSLPPLTLNSSPDPHDSFKPSISKGFRTVARSVKKSLHSLERPLALLADRKSDQLPHPLPLQQDASILSNLSNHPSIPFKPPHQPPKSSSAFTLDNHNASLKTSQRHRAPSAPPLANNPLLAHPPSRQVSVHRPKSRAVPSSALEPPLHRPIAPFGSLPQAASILARPPPDPSTFLAIIPGQPSSNLNLLIPPSSGVDHFLGDPNLSAATSRFPATSLQAQPPLSSRPSDPHLGLENDSGFTFIRSPSPVPHPPHPQLENFRSELEPSHDKLDNAPVPSSSDLDEDLSGSDWSRILDRSLPLPPRHGPIVLSENSISSPVSPFELDTTATPPLPPLSDLLPTQKNGPDPELSPRNVVPRLPEWPLYQSHSEPAVLPWNGPANGQSTFPALTHIQALPSAVTAAATSKTRHRAKLLRNRRLASQRIYLATRGKSPSINSTSPSSLANSSAPGRRDAPLMSSNRTSPRSNPSSNRSSSTQTETKQQNTLSYYFHVSSRPKIRLSNYPALKRQRLMDHRQDRAQSTKINEENQKRKKRLGDHQSPPRTTKNWFFEEVFSGAVSGALLAVAAVVLVTSVVPKPIWSWFK